MVSQTFGIDVLIYRFKNREPNFLLGFPKQIFIFFHISSGIYANFIPNINRLILFYFFLVKLCIFPKCHAKCKAIFLNLQVLQTSYDKSY
jgi:pilus assembly protein TadC